jgi:Tfp pilus assembly protein PilE
MKEVQRSSRLLLTVIICATVLLLAAIGSWVYIQRQDLAQKDRALQQQKQLKVYEQQQINQRQQQGEACKSSNPYQKFGAGC